MKTKLLLSAIMLSTALSGFAQTNVKFEANVESLQQYECPEWFRDAKFGIWSCWNAYTVAGIGDWYARGMYIEGSRQYNYHVKKFGHPTKVGYKDVVDMWKGEEFDPAEQIALFKKAGAKYFIAMANHHDNFDLWDSKYQKWNSVNYGPKKDIVGMWRKATLDAGLRWGVTSHLERTWSWFQVNKGADKKGPYKGIPYDGADPKNEFIYLPKEPTGDISHTQPINATPWWREHWYNRCVDLIANYKPDLFYVDGGVPFPGDDKGHTGLKMISELYNLNSSWHNGKNEAVMCLKNWLKTAPRGEWGFYWDGIGTLDFEKGRSNAILPEPWQTDTNLGSWTWGPNMKYRPASDLILELVDVVAKNGNLLVNITPNPQGKLDQAVIDLLADVGDWMKVNDESIFCTRPWLIMGLKDLRVVQPKGNKEKVLYLSSLKPLAGEELKVEFLKDNDKTKISKITLLGSGRVKFEESDKGLTIKLPKKINGKYVWVFKIEGENLNQYDVAKYKGKIAKSNVMDDLKVWVDISEKEHLNKTYKGIAFDRHSNKWGIDRRNTLVEFINGEVKRFPYKVSDVDFADLKDFSAFVTTDGDVYAGTPEEWKKLDGFPKSERVSVSNDGYVAVVTKDGTVWWQKPGEKPAQLEPKLFTNVLDLAFSIRNNMGLVGENGATYAYNNGKAGRWNSRGGDRTRIEYSPKTYNYMVIYNGEVAINRWGTWLFTGHKAKELASGKSNDDEIIGWVESE